MNRDFIGLTARPFHFQLYMFIGLLVSVFSLNVSASNAILPVTPPNKKTAERIELGDLLFHDTRLSADNTISCASCHDLSHNGADRRPFSVGVGGALGRIRSPSVYNSVLDFAQFWDGRAEDLQSQVDGPIHDEVEMATDWDAILEKLTADEELVKRFQNTYREGITADTIRDALAAFQTTLVLIDSPFDRWLNGDTTAITPKQLSGYQLFRSYGCISCHQGTNVGGNMYARMGSLENYFDLKGNDISSADLGRYNVTGNPAHRFVFKVPSLRTAALNDFFFHDASASSLEDAIVTMARFQLGRELPPEHIDKIAVFIESLVGSHPRLKPAQFDNSGQP